MSSDKTRRSERVLVGIDAGGTSTRAIAVIGGEVIWERAGPALNLSTTQGNDQRDSCRRLLEGCPKPDAICGAFAGLVSVDQRHSAETNLRESTGCTNVRAVADFEAALEACSPQANVCVIAGTGSIVCSKVDSEVKKTGGRGYVLGDEGSGFQFGRDAFLAFLDGSDEQVSDTLRHAIETTFGTTTKGDAVSALYTGNIARALATLAPALATDAENLQIYALKSLRTNMAKLGHVCRMHLKRYGPKEPVIGCQGGLWKSEVYRSAFVQALPLWCEIPPEKVLFDLPEPVFGAAAIAGSLRVD